MLQAIWLEGRARSTKSEQKAAAGLSLIGKVAGTPHLPLLCRALAGGFDR